jgi:hypothetical protein
MLLMRCSQDPSNLARILRLPSFLGRDGDDRDRQYSRRVAAERRKVSAHEQSIARLQTLQRLRGKVIPEEDPQIGLKNILDEWVRDVHDRYLDRIIRRDLSSTRWDGKNINESLPPKRVIIATCKLSAKELAVLDGEMDELSQV